MDLRGEVMGSLLLYWNQCAVVHAGEGFDSVGTGCFEDGGFNADDEPWAHYFVGFAFWCCFQGRILFTRSTSHFDVFVWDFDSMVVLKG